jgi:AraC-like DNA-binding protein
MHTWQTIRTSALPRHMHTEAYAALVLSGGYEEAGDSGRLQAEAGSVIFHDQFEAHLDRFRSAGTVILNLPLPPFCSSDLTCGLAKVADPDAVVRAAEKDRLDGVHLLISTAAHCQMTSLDWTDELATILIANPSLRLSRWAESRGIAAWSLSRRFAQVFGVSAETFRALSRARKAWKRIQVADEPLAQIAATLGFADQSHMTRAVKALTGAGPRAWRIAANRSKTSTRLQD